MRLGHFVAVAAGVLATAADAYVVMSYSETGCRGTANRRNVYDNTCASPMPDFKSFELIKNGGNGQYMRWFTNSCSFGEAGCEGAHNGLSLNKCVDLGKTKVWGNGGHGFEIQEIGKAFNSFAVTCLKSREEN